MLNEAKKKFISRTLIHILVFLLCFLNTVFVIRAEEARVKISIPENSVSELLLRSEFHNRIVHPQKAVMFLFLLHSHLTERTV